MSTLALAVGDSATMLRRNLKRLARYPSLTVLVIGMPVIFLLLFVYVFGGTLGSGLGGAAGVPAAIAGGGREAYANYVVPGILLLTVAAVAQSTAISVAMDMTEGIIARFRTMNIWRASVLSGHVVASLIQTFLSLVLLVLVGLLVGFRPSAGLLDWLGVAGILLLVGIAFTWMTVGIGLASKSVETASNLPMFLLLLPFLSSAFVPTDSMPSALAWFAEHQPFTPITETIRGLLLGTPVGSSAITAVIWCVAITLVSYVWSLRLYNRPPLRLAD